MRKKALTTEQIRKQIDARFKVVIRNGKVCVLDLNEEDNIQKEKKSLNN